MYSIKLRKSLVVAVVALAALLIGGATTALPAFSVDVKNLHYSDDSGRSIQYDFSNSPTPVTGNVIQLPETAVTRPTGESGTTYFWGQGPSPLPAASVTLDTTGQKATIGPADPAAGGVVVLSAGGPVSAATGTTGWFYSLELNHFNVDMTVQKAYQFRIGLGRDQSMGPYNEAALSITWVKGFFNGVMYDQNTLIIEAGIENGTTFWSSSATTPPTTIVRTGLDPATTSVMIDLSVDGGNHFFAAANINGEGMTNLGGYTLTTPQGSFLRLPNLYPYISMEARIASTLPNAEVKTLHFQGAGKYYAGFHVQDPLHLASSVRVTGNGNNYVGQGVDLTWNESDKSWNSLQGYEIGTTPVSNPFPSFIFTFTPQTGGTAIDPVTKTITGYVTEFASGLLPTGNLATNPVFTWTGIAGASGYGIELNDGTTRIWDQYGIPASQNTFSYNGPSLTNGKTYNYHILSHVNQGDVWNDSLAAGSFTYTGTGGGGTSPQVMTYTGKVVLATNYPAAAVSGAAVDAYDAVRTDHPALGSATTFPDGSFTLANILAGNAMLLKITGNDFPTYSGFIPTVMGNIDGKLPYALFSAADVSSWSLWADRTGRGSITGLVMDATDPAAMAPINGAVVRAHKSGDPATTYPVYYSGENGFVTGADESTAADGKYFLFDIPAGEMVIVSVEKFGYNWAFQSTTFLIYGGAIHEESFFGTADTAGSVLYRDYVVSSNPTLTGPVKIEHVGASTVNRTHSLPADGSFAIRVPKGGPFYFRLFRANYVPTYTADISRTADFQGNPTGTTSFDLFAQSNLTGWGVTPGKGIIRTRVRDQAGNYVSGVTVTAQGNSKAYTVCYSNTGDPCSSTSATDTTGRYVVRDVEPGDTVIVTAQKAGYTFNTRTYHIYADSVHQGGLTVMSSVTLATSGQNFATADAGTGSVNVTATAGTAWMAVNNDPGWITITSGGSGTGNGTVNFSVSANTGAARTGTITISGQIFTITQAAGTGGGTITVSGIVKDWSGYNIPSPGVTVSVVGDPTKTTVTDPATGNFSLAGIPANTLFSLKLSAAGYLDVYTPNMSFAADYNLNMNSNGSTFFSMPTVSNLTAFGAMPTSGKGMMAGRVADGNFRNATVGGVTVAATGNGGKVYPVLYRDPFSVLSNQSSTWGNGRYYVLDVDDSDTVTLTATKSGWTFNPSSYTTHASGVSMGRLYGTGPGVASMAGAVVDLANAPISGARLEINGDYGKFTTAGGDGSYNFTGLPRDANFYAKVTATGYAPTFAGSVYLSGDVAGINISLWTTAQMQDPSIGRTTAGNGIMSFRATDSSMTPLSGATVVLTSRNSAAYTVVYVGGGSATDATGKFFVPNIQPGDVVKVEVTKGGYTFPVTYMDGFANAVTSKMIVGTAAVVTLSASGQNFTTGDAGSGSVNVTAGAGTAWMAVGNVGWITITSGGSGTGNGTVNFSVSANPGSTPRTGTLTIGGQTFTVTQAGTGIATITVSGIVKDWNGNNIPSPGVTVTVVGDSSKTTTTDPATGNFSLPGVPANTLFSLKLSAAGYLDVYTPNMSFAADYNLNASTTGVGILPYNMPTAADLTAFGAMPASGKGLMAGRVADGTYRNATVGGVTVAATGNGGKVYQVLYRDPFAVLSNQSTTWGNGRYYVLDVDDADAVTLTATKSGWSFNPSSYTTHANGVSMGRLYRSPSTLASMGGMVVNTAGAGIAGARLEMNGDNGHFTTAGGDGSYNFTDLPQDANFYVKVTASGYVPNFAGTINLSANATGINLMLFTPAEMSNYGVTGTNGILGCRVIDRSTMASLSGATVQLTSRSQTAYTVSYAGGGSATNQSGNFIVPNILPGDTVKVEVTKAGYTFPAYYLDGFAGAQTGKFLAGTAVATLSASGQAFTTADAGTGSVNVTAGAGTAWMAVSNVGWITITSGGSGTGNGTVNFSVSANPGSARTGTITIAGLTFTVTQAGTAGAPPYVGTWGAMTIHRENNGNWYSESSRLTFNGNGSGAVVGTYNDGGKTAGQRIVPFTETFSYTATPNGDGSYTLAMNFSGNINTHRFVFSDSGDTAIADGTDRTNQVTLTTLVRIDTAKGYANSDVSGDYYAVGFERNVDNVVDPPNGNGGYMAISALQTFSGAGSYSYFGKASSVKIDGSNFIWDDPGLTNRPYTVNSDGSFTGGGGAYLGYLSGNGKVLAGAGSYLSNNWVGYFFLKKGDRTYQQIDLAGKWALVSFGQDNRAGSPMSFGAQIGTVTCDAAGLCSFKLRDRISDGSSTISTGNTMLSVAADGSFGGSIGGPAYAGAIGNNGNTILFNGSFDPAKTWHREISVGIRVNGVGDLAGSAPTGTFSFSDALMRYSDSTPVNLGVVEMVGNPSMATTTASDGTFTLAGLPADTPLTLKLTKPVGDPTDYLTTYSSVIQGAPGSAIISPGSFNLYTPAELNFWTGGSGRGVIRGRVANSASSVGYISGAVVTASGPRAYRVRYEDQQKNLVDQPEGTYANGRYYILDVAEGDTVVVSASQPNYTFPSARTFITHDGAVSQGRVYGNPVAGRVAIGGFIKDSAATPVGINNATVEQAGPTTPTNATVSGSDGGWYLTVPPASPIHLKFSKPQSTTPLAPTYTAEMMFGAENLNIGDFNLFPVTKLGTGSGNWNITPGKGIIRSRVRDQAGNYIGGATVSYTSLLGNTYAICYDDACTVGLTSTQSIDGRYVIRDVAPGDTVTVTAQKAGYTFYARIFHTYADSVHQGSVTGTPVALSASSQNFTTADAGTGSVTVNTSTGTPWSALSNAAWITITSGASGSGTGAVNFSISANPGPTSRTGTITIGGQTFTVTQAGTGGSTITFSGWVRGVPSWPSIDTALPVAGAVIQAFNVADSSLSGSTTSAADGSFTITGIPASLTFRLVIPTPASTTYVPVLSKLMNWNTNIQADRPFALFTPEQYAAFGNQTGTSMILGRVGIKNNPTAFLAGAVVEAREWTGGNPPVLGATYPVTYTGGSSSTAADGVYMVKNVPAGKMVQLVATLPGHTFDFNGVVIPVEAGHISEESFSSISGLPTQVMIYSSETAFSNVASSATVIDFENRDTSSGRVSFAGNEYAAAGITFSSPNSQPLWVYPPVTNFWTWSSKYLSPGNAPFEGGDTNEDSLTVTFATPVAAVGWSFLDMPFPSAVTIRAYDQGGGLIYEALNGTGIGEEVGGSGRFWGIVSPITPIKRVEIIDTANNGDDIAYDNFRFAATLTPATVPFSSYVADQNTVGISGATIEQVGAVPPNSTTSSASPAGAYTLNVPTGVPFYLKFSKAGAGYADTYTANMSRNVAYSEGLADGNNLFPTTRFGSGTGNWNIAAGKGIIRAKVKDSLTNPIAGAIVSYTSSLGNTYAICYDDACTAGLTSTQSSNGRYIIRDVVPGDTVSVTAQKAGYTFNTRIFHTYADSVHQGGVTGTTAVTLSASGQDFTTADAGTGSVNVAATAGAPWSAMSNAAWITITSGASGTGNGTVNFSVSANPGPTPRTGTITISGQTFTVTQAGTGGVTITVSGIVKDWSGYNIPAPGVAVTVVGDPSKTTNTDPATGNFSLAGIPANTMFSLKLSAAGYLDVYTPNMSFAADYNLNVNSNGSTFFSMPTVNNLTAFGAMPASGKGMMAGRVADGSFRNATVGGVTVTATGNGGKVYPVSYRDPFGVLTTGGSTWGNGRYYVLDVDDGDTVTLTATKNGWSFNPGTYTTHANSVSMGRLYGTGSGVASMAGAVVDLANAPISGARLEINGDYGKFTTAGVDGSYNFMDLPRDAFFYAKVTASGYVPTYAGPIYLTGNLTGINISLWTADQMLTGGMTTSGNGIMTFRVIDPSMMPLSGATVVLTSRSQTAYTVVYVGGGNATDATGKFFVPNILPGDAVRVDVVKSGYTFPATYMDGFANAVTSKMIVGMASVVTLSASGQNFTTAAAGSGSVNVTATVGFSWSASSNDPSWITITSGASGTGNGTVNFSVSANPGPTPRTGTLTIAGQTFTVTQAGTGGGTITVSGIVKDWSGYNIPAPGVAVTVVGDPSKTTNTDPATGNFSLAGIPANTMFSLKLSAAGYLDVYSSNLSFTTDLNLNVNSNGSTFFSMPTVNNLTAFGAMPASGKGMMAGRVADGSFRNATVGGVTVTATGNGGKVYPVSYRDPFGVLTTGGSTWGNGRYYVLDVDDGDTVTLTATKSGWTFSPGTYTTYTTHANGVSMGRLYGAVPGVASMAGAVVDLSNAPISGAKLEINGDYGKFTTAGVDGSYNFTGLPMGANFYAKVTATGYAPTFAGTINLSGDVAGINISLWTTAQMQDPSIGRTTAGNGIMSFRATDSSMTSLSGATVVLTSRNSAAYTVVYVGGGSATDATGKFFVPNIQPGDVVKVEVTKGGYTFPVTYMDGFANAVTSKMIVGTAAATVPYSSYVSESGNTVGISGATIEQVGASPANSTTSSASPAGAYTLNVPVGVPFYLKFSKTGYADTYTANMSRNAAYSEGLADGNNLFPPSQLTGWAITPGKGVIRARVKDQSGAYVAGATVTAQGLSKGYTVCYGNSGDACASPLTATDAATGRYVVKDVDAGDIVTVTAQKAGYTFSTRTYHTYADSVHQNGITVMTFVAPTTSGQDFTTADAGTGSVNVSATAGAAWMAVNNDPGWITITSGGSGTGNGTVNFSVSANPAPTPRTGTITIAGQTFTVTQAGTGISAIKGDLDGSGTVDLADAIIAAQAVSGLTPTVRSNYAVSGADVNGDGRVGLAELVYILQWLAGLRVDPVAQLEQEAVAGVNDSLALFKQTWNTYGMTYDYLPFFSMAYLNDGLNRTSAAQNDMPPAGFQITSYIVNHVISFNSVQKIITVAVDHAGTLNSVPESGTSPETFIFDTPSGKWLRYGNQNAGEFSVWLGKSRTMGVGATTDKLIAHFHLKALKDQVTQVVVNGPAGWTQTFANRQPWADDPNFDGFYTQTGAMDVDLVRTPQVGDSYSFVVSKASGGTVTYTQTLQHVLTEAPAVTSPTGHSFAGLPGSRLSLAWTLPDPNIGMDGIRIESSFTGVQGSMLGVVTSPTSGYIDIPAGATTGSIDVRIHYLGEIFTDCRFEFGN